MIHCIQCSYMYCPLTEHKHVDVLTMNAVMTPVKRVQTVQHSLLTFTNKRVKTKNEIKAWAYLH